MTKQSILNYLLITLFQVSCNNVEVINKKDVDQDSNISSVEYKQDTLSRWVGGFEEVKRDKGIPSFSSQSPQIAAVPDSGWHDASGGTLCARCCIGGGSLKQAAA